MKIGEGSSEPVVGRTTASSSSKPARTCVQRVSVRGAGQGQAAGRRRHSVSRPANTPHRQQRGAGAVEGQSTAKPQLAAPKGGKGPQGLSEASGPVPRRARRRLGLPAPLRSGFRGGVRVFRTQSESKPRSKQQVFSGVDTDTGQRVAKLEALQHRHSATLAKSPPPFRGLLRGVLLARPKVTTQGCRRVARSAAGLVRANPPTGHHLPSRPSPSAICDLPPAGCCSASHQLAHLRIPWSNSWWQGMPRQHNQMQPQRQPPAGPSAHSPVQFLVPRSAGPHNQRQPRMGLTPGLKGGRRFCF